MPFERNKEFVCPETEVTVELIRRDADHDMWDAIQRQRLADDVRIGAQLVLPEPVSQNHDRLSPVCAVESRSPRQRHADRLEVVGRDKHRATASSCLSSRKRDFAWRRRPTRSSQSRYRRRAGPRSPDRTTVGRAVASQLPS